MQSNNSTTPFFENNSSLFDSAFDNQAFDPCRPVFAPQHSWEFGECKITKTNSLPITPSTNWDKLSFPVHQNNGCDNSYDRESIIQELLASWDPRIDEFFNQYQYHLLMPNESFYY